MIFTAYEKTPEYLRAKWQRAGHLAPNGSALCAHQNHEDHCFYRLFRLDLEGVQGL